MACNNCYPQPCNCGCPTPCPDPLIPCNNNGCIQTITSSCVSYDGNNVDCAGISSGQTINQVIEELGNTVCNFSNFNCSDLNGCSIDALGDVVTPSPVSGEVLIFNGTNWVNDTIVVPDPFTCSDLNGCSINDLEDVITTSAASGDILIYNGTNWVIGTLPAPPTPPTAYTSNNGITKTSYNFQLGGDLVKNTSITGAGFDLALGESGSKIDLLSARTNTLDLQSDVISLNTTTLGTQTKGFLFKDSSESLSIGTDVFGNFDTYPSSVRIGKDITHSGAFNSGTFIGTNITTSSVIANAIGTNMTLTAAGGFYMGISLTVNGGALGVGGTSFGNELHYTGGGTGNQSGWLFGTNIYLTQAASIPQSNLVFNIANTNITSSSTGLGTNDKIKVDVSGKHIATFNMDEYYLFTSTGDGVGKGWANEKDLVIINSNYIRISQSTGPVASQEKGCIRYNSSSNKLEVYTGAGWETVTSL